MDRKKEAMACTAAATLLSAVLLTAAGRKIPQTEPARTENVQQTAVQQTQDMYLIRADGWYLSVYRCGEQDPVLQTDIDIRLMREIDRQSFKQGVTVLDDEALSKILEDYES